MPNTAILFLTKEDCLRLITFLDRTPVAGTDNMMWTIEMKRKLEGVIARIDNPPTVETESIIPPPPPPPPYVAPDSAVIAAPDLDVMAETEALISHLHNSGRRKRKRKTP